MTPNPVNPEQEIDEESLTRQMIDHLDSVLTQYGYTYNSLNKSRFYREINNLFGRSLQTINDSHNPQDTQFAILLSILPNLRQLIEADHLFLLTPDLRTQSTFNTGNSTRDTDQLRIIGEDASSPVGDRYPAPVDGYRLSKDGWNELQQRGIEVRRLNVDTPGIKLIPDPQFEQRRGKKTYELPTPDYPANMVTLVVGAGMSPTGFVLIFHKKWDYERTAKNLEDFRDVFDLLMQRLRDLREQAEHRIKEIDFNNARTEFMQDVLHQIRGSVSSLSSHVRYLQLETEGPLQGELHRLYKSIQVLRDSAESSYLATEKRSILDVYDEPEEIFYGKHWVELLYEYSDIFAGEAHSVGVQGPFISERGFEYFRPVHVRKNLVKLVIFNLIQNAVKYSRPGTAVHLEGHATPASMEIKVTNSGLGPDMDELDSLFQRHFRSRVVREQMPTGTGIGLYLCKKIMEGHGGEIHLSSRQLSPDDPTLKEVTVLLRFPIIATAEIPVLLPEDVAQHPLPLPQPPLKIRQENQDKPTILYVEDEYYQHEYLIKLLNRHFNVVAAYTGNQALDLLDRDYTEAEIPEFRLILLDIRLSSRTPGRFTGDLGGIELARAILHERGYEIPIIAYTGNLVKQMQEELREIGVVEAISRTQGSEDELIKLIWRHLGY